MDIEKKQEVNLVVDDINLKGKNETSYLFERFKESFDFVTEKIVDCFTFSKFQEFLGGEVMNDVDKSIIENLIHQLRTEIRKDFHEIFFQVCRKHRAQEHFEHLTFELEKAKILKDFDEIGDRLFSQGSNYYFQFLSGVVGKLRQANEEVRSDDLACRHESSPPLIILNNYLTSSSLFLCCLNAFWSPSLRSFSETLSFAMTD